MLDIVGYAIAGDSGSGSVVVIGHLFQLIGIFLAFLATGIAFVYANLIKGGIAGRAALLNAFGFMILAIDIFLIYSSAITGNLDLLDVTILWPILGLLTTIGFSMIAYAQYRLWRITKN